MTAPNLSVALARAAETLLRTLGGETVTLVFPATADANDLGLGPAQTEEVTLAPVVVRALPVDGSGVRRELLFPAAAVAEQIESRGAVSAETLFQSALGVLHQRRLLHIESVTPERFAGSTYLVRVVVRDQP